METPVTITREEIAKANDEAVALADSIFEMSWQLRTVFMERFLGRLGERLCLHCWYDECRCSQHQ